MPQVPPVAWVSGYLPSEMTPRSPIMHWIVALIGFFAFDEVPDFWVWVGAAVICASTYYITRADQRAAAARTGGK